MHRAVFDYEDLSPERTEEWIGFNKRILEKLKDSETLFVQEHPIDARLLRMQIRTAIEGREQEADRLRLQDNDVSYFDFGIEDTFPQ